MEYDLSECTGKNVSSAFVFFDKNFCHQLKKLFIALSPPLEY